jgi:predicted phage tail protein
VSFGNVTVNTSSAQTVTLTNGGGISVTVSGLSISGTGFSLAQVSTPFALVAGGTKSLTVTFSPQAAGNASGSITVASNAANPDLSIPVSGTGVTAATHSVTLSWTASTSHVVGYNCYRSTGPSSSFSVLNGSLISSTSFVDYAVQSGSTYYYYVTAVDTLGNESMPSNHVSATIP